MGMAGRLRVLRKPLALTKARGSGGAPMARPPLERMQKLHRLIAAGKYPNCRSLAEELEVSPKTIQRDIDFMRDRMDYPIEYDPLRFGFHYTQPVTAFPQLELAEGELVALLI